MKTVKIVYEKKVTVEGTFEVSDEDYDFIVDVWLPDEIEDKLNHMAKTEAPDYDYRVYDEDGNEL